MVGEEVVEASSPASLDHQKRKLEDLETDTSTLSDEEVAAVVQTEKAAEVELGGLTKDVDVEVAVKEACDGSEAKRPRLDDKPDVQACQNGQQMEKEKAVEENSGRDAISIGDMQNPPSVIVNEEHAVQEDTQRVESQLNDTLLPSSEIVQAESVEKPSEDKLSLPAADVPQQHGIMAELDISGTDTQTTSQKIEVPNNKVGVLIGKAGDTIRYLQYNSGAKIQITRDADADPWAATRPVELIGTLESISKAEKLIKDVIAEADAGGSPSLVARGFTTTLAAGAMEQVQIQIPNERVGLIIGKGGETIKNLQTRSGARIQLIPQHLPEGDQSKERTIRVCGDKKQIEMARELIKEVMNQTVRPSVLSSNYNQQQFHRLHGPAGGSPQWRARGPHNPQPTPYNYHQPRGGPYPSQTQQYPPHGSFPSMGPLKGNFGSGWDQRPPMQGPHSHGSGYDSFYGGQGGQTAGIPPSAAHHPPMGQNMAPTHSQQNYNYTQPPPSSYPQAAPPHHQSYSDLKYENPVPSQQSYSGGIAQSGSYVNAQGQGYLPQQQHYRPPPPYGAPTQAGPAPPQTYPSQPSDNNAPYQASVSVPPLQSYGQHVPPQQMYPYGSTPTAAGDPYTQPPPQAAGAVPGYCQPGGVPPVAGYGQPQQTSGGYPQGYGQYPQTQQPGYGDQTGSGVAGYGYQGQADPSSYAAGQAYTSTPATAGQAAYAQPGTAQAAYDQSVAQPGPYLAPVQGSTLAGYGKTVSPQPGGGYPPQQYDVTQMYGAAR